MTTQRLPVVTLSTRLCGVLVQASIIAEVIGKTVSILVQNHHIFDVGELFQCGVDLGGHTRISANAGREEISAEVQCRGLRFRL